MLLFLAAMNDAVANILALIVAMMPIFIITEWGCTNDAVGTTGTRSQIEAANNMMHTAV